MVFAAEAFVVCQRYQPPSGFQPASLRQLLDAASTQFSPTTHVCAPFVACGDLSGLDADQSYDLPEEAYTFLAPVQPPTAPAYATALHMQKV